MRTTREREKGERGQHEREGVAARAAARAAAQAAIAGSEGASEVRVPPTIRRAAVAVRGPTAAAAAAATMRRRAAVAAVRAMPTPQGEDGRCERRKAAAEREDGETTTRSRAGVYGVCAPAIGWWAAAVAAVRRGARAGAAARRAGAGASVFGSEVRLRLRRALLVARATQRLLLRRTLGFRGAQLVGLLLRVFGDCARVTPPTIVTRHHLPPIAALAFAPTRAADWVLVQGPRKFNTDPKRTGRSCSGDALCLFSRAAVRRLRRSMGVSFFGASTAGNPADTRAAGRTPAPGGRLASPPPPPPPPPRLPPEYGSAAGSRCSASRMGCSRCLP